MAISVREVTDVDRRTARRLGMDAEKVNLVINVWAEEYLTAERQSASLKAAASPEPVKPRRPRKATAKATPNGSDTGPGMPETVTV